MNSGADTTIDMVNEPPHYKNSSVVIEPIEVLKYMDFCLGNAFKYVIRAGKKGDYLEDLKKAQWYFNKAGRGPMLCMGDPEDQKKFNVLLTFFMTHTDNKILKAAQDCVYDFDDYPQKVKEVVDATIESLEKESRI